MNLRFLFAALVRSPLRTAVTFALLIAVSFAFISRGAEYYQTKNLLLRTESEYTAVGTLVAAESKIAETSGLESAEYDDIGGYFAGGLETAKYYSPISDEAAELIHSSKYVKDVETRHVAGGFSDEYETVMEQPYSGDTLMLDAAVVIAECHTTMPSAEELLEGTDLYSPNTEIDIPSYVYYSIEKVLAGDGELYPLGDPPLDDEGVLTRWIGYTTPFWDREAEIYSRFKEGHRYILALKGIGTFKGTDIAQVICGGVWHDTTEVTYPLVDLTLMEEEKGAPLTEEDYAFVLEDRFTRITRDNHKKEDLVYTSDMSKLQGFHDGTLYIASGRMITPEDDGDVCVINAEFAERNGFSVGDKITFDVDPNTGACCGEVLAREVYDPNPRNVGAEYTSYDLERVEKTYEVIGIWTQDPREGYTFHSGTEDLSWYTDTDPNSPLISSRNTVFVPAGTYPWSDEEVPAQRLPSTFTFTLKHPGDMRKIEEELSDKLAELGYILQIDDEGYSRMAEGFKTMKAGALISFLSMALAMLLSLALIVYLFIMRRKSEYAIMRALGVPETRAGASLLVGLTALGVVSAAVGCLLSFLTMRGFAARLAAALAEMKGEAVTVTVSVLPILAFGVATVVLLLLGAVYGLHRIGSKPPLSLLQNGKK